MRMDGKVTGEALFMAGNATVTGDVTIGKQVGIWFGAVVRADKDRITIGDRSNIQDNCVVHTSKGFPVTLGRDVSVGHGAILHGCTIADQVLVGMGAIVLNGATDRERIGHRGRCGRPRGTGYTGRIRLLSGSRGRSSSRPMQPSSSRS